MVPPSISQHSRNRNSNKLEELIQRKLGNTTALDFVSELPEAILEQQPSTAHGMGDLLEGEGSDSYKGVSASLINASPMFFFFVNLNGRCVRIALEADYSLSAGVICLSKEFKLPITSQSVGHSKDVDIVEVNAKVDGFGKDNVQNDAFYTEVTLLKTEYQVLRDCNQLSAHHWIIGNMRTENRMGQLTEYKLVSSLICLPVADFEAKFLRGLNVGIIIFGFHFMRLMRIFLEESSLIRIHVLVKH